MSLRRGRGSPGQPLFDHDAPSSSQFIQESSPSSEDGHMSPVITTSFSQRRLEASSALSSSLPSPPPKRAHRRSLDFSFDCTKSAPPLQKLSEEEVDFGAPFREEEEEVSLGATQIIEADSPLKVLNRQDSSQSRGERFPSVKRLQEGEVAEESTPVSIKSVHSSSQEFSPEDEEAAESRRRRREACLSSGKKRRGAGGKRRRGRQGGMAEGLEAAMRQRDSDLALKEVMGERREGVDYLDLTVTRVRGDGFGRTVTECVATADAAKRFDVVSHPSAAEEWLFDPGCEVRVAQPFSLLSPSEGGGRGDDDEVTLVLGVKRVEVLDRPVSNKTKERVIRLLASWDCPCEGD